MQKEFVPKISDSDFVVNSPRIRNCYNKPDIITAVEIESREIRFVYWDEDGRHEIERITL